MSNPIDVVYVLGKGSIWHNNEIRYSLRSVQQHLKGYRNIWIIGELPIFIRGVHWIKMQDVGHNKELRIMNKIAQACLCDTISDEFLFMNDDHFFLKDVDAREYPFYHKGILQQCIAERPADNEYTRAMVNTQNAIAQLMHNKILMFGNIKNFDTHTPIRYSKTEFKTVMKMFDWKVQDGYIIKSLYANALAVPYVFEEDMKITQHLGRADFLSKLEGRHVFSIADMAINDHSMQIFKELYPKKSQWEV